MAQTVVLIADDSDLFLASMQAIIEILFPDIQVLRASNALEVLEVSLKSPPHLILLDLYLPPCSSHGVAAMLRSSPRTRDISIVLMTNPALVLLPAERSLYQTILPKPFPIKALSTCIENTVHQPGSNSAWNYTAEGPEGASWASGYVSN
jgi:CheY-like chemotaxis protein